MKKNNYEIKYLSSYIEDLTRILNYIMYNLENENATERLLENINKAIIERSLSPESYEKYNRSKNSNYAWYRIYVENYTIFYTVEGNTMEIVRILSNRRDFEKIF